MKKIFAIALISGLLFSSCKKEDNCNLTEESLVGTYRLTALTYKLDAQSADQNVLNSLDECERDNVFIFNSDRTLYYQDAGISCNPPQNDNGNWSLNGSTLTFDGENNNVISFDCNSMVTETRDVQFQGDVLTASYMRL